MRFLSRAGAGLLVFLLALPIVGCSSGSSGGGSSANTLLNAARGNMIPGRGAGDVEILGPLPAVNESIIFNLVQIPVNATPSTSSEGTTMGFGRMQGLAPDQSISYQYEYFAPEAGVVGIGFRFGLGGSIWMLPQPSGTATLLDGSLALDLEFPEDTGVCGDLKGRCGTYELYAFAITEDPVTGERQISEPAIVSGALLCDPGAFAAEGCRPGDLDCAMCSEPSCLDLIAACNTNVIVQTIIKEESEDRDDRGCFSGLLEHTILNAPPESFFHVESSWNETASGSIGSNGTLSLEIPTPLHCPCLEGSVNFFLDGVLIGTTTEFGAQFLICAEV